MVSENGLIEIQNFKLWLFQKNLKNISLDFDFQSFECLPAELGTRESPRFQNIDPVTEYKYF